MRQQESAGETIPRVEALAQILTSVERLAMLHYHFARTLVEELGDPLPDALRRNVKQPWQ